MKEQTISWAVISITKGFKSPDGDGSTTFVSSSSKVGPTIADDIRKSALYAALFALLFHLRLYFTAIQ